MNKKGSEQFISDHGQKVSKMIPLLMLFIFGGTVRNKKNKKTKRTKSSRVARILQGGGVKLCHTEGTHQIFMSTSMPCVTQKSLQKGVTGTARPPPPPPLPSSYALEKEVECGIRSLYKPKDYLRLETMSSYSPLV